MHPRTPGWFTTINLWRLCNIYCSCSCQKALHNVMYYAFHNKACMYYCLTGSESLNSRPATTDLAVEPSSTYIKPTLNSRLRLTVSLSPQENSPVLLFAIYILCTAFGGFIAGMLVVCVVLLVNQRKRRERKQGLPQNQD